MTLTKEKDLKNKILNLTNDIAFKRVFQDEKYKWYLSFLISYCTKIDIDIIYKNLKYKNNSVLTENLESKTGEADILVEIDNMVINVEMNKEVTETLIRKNKYYVSSLDSINTSKTRDKVIDNKYIVQINISTKRRIPNTNVLMYEIVQMDRNIKKEDVYNNTIIYDINLEYLKKELYNKNKLTKEEKRLLIFIETNKKKLKEIFRGDKNMNETVEDLEMDKFYKKDIEFYNSYDHEEFKKIVHEEAMEEERREIRQEAEEKGRSEGLAKGLTKGLAKGLAKGRAEGHAEGFSEGQTSEKINIAKKSLSKGIDIDTISQITGLSLEEINKLK